MSIVLRVDVDKPYGHSNIIFKVLSKVVEDYIGKGLTKTPFYLWHQAQFLNFCNQHQVSGYFYYRTCTIPNQKILDLMKQGGHHIGFHAENTKTYETFESELISFKNKLAPFEVSTFSKHGSGKLKLGKYHYPNYEPEKYLEWAKKVGCKFPSGNGICTSPEDFEPKSTSYFENIFWIEPEYRSISFNTIDQLIEVAKSKRVIVLIHPENFVTHQQVYDEFSKLVSMAKAEGITWELPFD